MRARAAVVAALLAATAAGQSPQIERLAPAGAQRGTEVTVVITGQRLLAPQGLLPTRPGIEVLAVAGDKPERCSVQLRILADCPLGAHPLRLRTADGITNLMLFHVGALPEVAEQRQGDAPQVLPLGCTVDGALGNEEVDRYAVELAAGARVHCEVQGLRLGNKPLDLELLVTGPDGGELARADDSAFGGKDPLLGFVAATPGTHVLQLRAAFADPANAGPYRLHVGSFPRPVGCLPCGGQPGEELEVQLLGDASLPAGTTLRVRLPEHAEDTFPFHPELGGEVSPTPILLRVGGPPNRAPTIDAQGRAWVEFPGSVHGVVTAPDQPVRFHWKAKKGQEWEFRCLARSLRSPLDPSLVVRAADGRQLGANDDALGLDSLLRLTVPADGDYVLEVRDLLRRGGPDRFFRLEGAERRDKPTLRLVVGRREDAALAVPQGNRAGAVLQWSGLSPNDAMELLAHDLPAGVTAHFGPLRRGSNLVPMVLSAAAEAPLAGSQMGFALRDAADAAPRDPGFAQLVPLVNARNDQPLFGVVQRRLPVVVTSPAPFALHVVPPAVPIVRGAPLVLPVRIERSDGFTERITLKALWNVPGLGSGEVEVADGADGALPFSADGNAPTGRVTLAVVGQARLRGGLAKVCSDFVELQVDEPWLTADAGKVRTGPGTTVELTVKLQSKRPLPGPCRARLLGLPRGVASDPVDFAADAGELRLPLRVAADAATGRHRGVLLQILVPSGPDASAPAVEHRFAAGELRIDAPVAKAAEETR